MLYIGRRKLIGGSTGEIGLLSCWLKETRRVPAVLRVSAALGGVTGKLDEEDEESVSSASVSDRDRFFLDLASFWAKAVLRFPAEASSVKRSLYRGLTFH